MVKRIIIDNLSALENELDVRIYRMIRKTIIDTMKSRRAGTQFEVKIIVNAFDP